MLLYQYLLDWQGIYKGLTKSSKFVTASSKLSGSIFPSQLEFRHHHVLRLGNISFCLIVLLLYHKTNLSLWLSRAPINRLKSCPHSIDRSFLSLPSLNRFVVPFHSEGQKLSRKLCLHENNVLSKIEAESRQSGILTIELTYSSWSQSVFTIHRASLSKISYVLSILSSTISIIHPPEEVLRAYPFSATSSNDR